MRDGRSRVTTPRRWRRRLTRSRDRSASSRGRARTTRPAASSLAARAGEWAGIEETFAELNVEAKILSEELQALSRSLRGR